MKAESHRGGYTEHSLEALRSGDAVGSEAEGTSGEQDEGSTLLHEQST